MINAYTDYMRAALEADFDRLRGSVEVADAHLETLRAAAHDMSERNAVAFDDSHRVMWESIGALGWLLSDHIPLMITRVQDRALPSDEEE